MEDVFPESQDARVYSLWSALDVNNTGRLDLVGLKAGLRKMDHPLKNADDLLREVLKLADKTGIGCITYHDFAAFVKHAEIELWTLFTRIDRNQDGRLSKAELKDAFAKAGIRVSNSKLQDFFTRIDVNHDGVITFDEWRDFLLFIPADTPGLKAVLSYYAASVKLNAEGDVLIGDEAIEGLGMRRIRHRPPDVRLLSKYMKLQLLGRDAAENPLLEEWSEPEIDLPVSRSAQNTKASWESLLINFLPKPGYFLAGGMAGIVSRTFTAPLDRLKVYLIAHTGRASSIAEAAKSGAALKATKYVGGALIDATKALWRAGGIRSLFAGNGLNVVKVMPESAIKFGSYESTKRVLNKISGYDGAEKLPQWTQFLAGGIAGMISQFFVYPIDTLKFRMQCETVQGGLHGNALIMNTAKKTWTQGGIRSFYRGLPMGLIGMFPYSAIDLGTFEYLKRTVTARNAKARGCHEEDAAPGAIITAMIGGVSGALGASLVYPINLLRTRLQTQGTAAHRPTYHGILDVTKQTIQGEGFRGLFKGLTPNLLKVVPAVSITYVVYENSKRALNLAW